MRFLCGTFLICITAFSQRVFAQSCKSLDDLQVFLGNWRAESPNNVTTESWAKVSDHSFEGKGLVEDRSGSPDSSESLRIVEMSGEIFYIAKVKANEFPTSFKLTRCNQSKFDFENPTHDFPKKISYKFIKDKKLIVTVGGNDDEAFEINFQKSARSDN